MRTERKRLLSSVWDSCEELPTSDPSGTDDGEQEQEDLHTNWVRGLDEATNKSNHLQGVDTHIVSVPHS